MEKKEQTKERNQTNTLPIALPGGKAMEQNADVKNTGLRTRRPANDQPRERENQAKAK